MTKILIKGLEIIAIKSPTQTPIKIQKIFFIDFESPPDIIASYPAYTKSHIAITEKDHQRYVLIKLIKEKIVSSLSFPLEELIRELFLLCSVLILRSFVKLLSHGNLTSTAKLTPNAKTETKIRLKIFFNILITI